MKAKPIKPALHGIIDYLFSGIQMAMPLCLGLNKKTLRTYATLGAGFMVVNALTDTPVVLKSMLSLKEHQKADAVFLASLGFLTTVSFIIKDERSLAFHLAFLATAVTNYAFTDYDAQNA